MGVTTSVFPILDGETSGGAIELGDDDLGKFWHGGEAEAAKEAFRTGRTVREVASEMSGIPADRLDALLDPKTQTGTT